MSEKKPEFAMWFHKFLIYGMLWICGIGLIAIGIRNTCIAIEDGVSPLILVILTFGVYGPNYTVSDFIYFQF